MKRVSIALLIGLAAIGCDKAAPKPTTQISTPEEQEKMRAMMGKPAVAAVPGSTEEAKPEATATPEAKAETPAAEEKPATEEKPAEPEEKKE